MSRSRTLDVACLVWLASFSTLVFAAGTLSQDVLDYDWISLVFALAAGLFGGIARTIYSLASDRFVVLSIWRELAKDMLVAMIGGGVAYVVIQGLGSLEVVKIPRDLRMLLIAAAGWSRGRWFGVVNRGAENLVDNALSKVRGTPLPESPSSAAVPLEGKK